MEWWTGTRQCADLRSSRVAGLERYERRASLRLRRVLRISEAARITRKSNTPLLLKVELDFVLPFFGSGMVTAWDHGKGIEERAGPLFLMWRHVWTAPSWHVWTAPSWQALSSRSQHWSVRPCVRPLGADSQITFGL